MIRVKVEARTVLATSSEAMMMGTVPSLEALRAVMMRGDVMVEWEARVMQVAREVVARGHQMPSARS